MQSHPCKSDMILTRVKIITILTGSINDHGSKTKSFLQQ